MSVLELEKKLKRFPETAEVCIDDGEDGLLPIRDPIWRLLKKKCRQAPTLTSSSW